MQSELWKAKQRMKQSLAALLFTAMVILFTISFFVRFLFSSDFIGTKKVHNQSKVVVRVDHAKVYNRDSSER